MGLILWRLAATRRGLWLPGPVTRALLALGMAAVVLARFHTLNGLAAGTTRLLLLMAALKLLEARGTRDQLVLIRAGLFLLLAACLDRQDLARTPLYALQAWLRLRGAGRARDADATRARSLDARRARAASCPAPRGVAVCLLSAPARVLLGDHHAARRRSPGSRFHDPGGIAQLVADYSTAFRVKFEGARPGSEALYWRGPVLHEFDGQTWRRAEEAVHCAPGPRVQAALRALSRVAQPTRRRRTWFALDLPAHARGAARAAHIPLLLLGSDPINEPVSYEAVSYLRARAVDPLGAAARRRGHCATPYANPRTQELAQTLYQRAGTDGAFVGRGAGLPAPRGFRLLPGTAAARARRGG